MDTLPIKRKKPRCRSNAPRDSSPMLFLPEELLAEIIQFFNVKTIVRLKCLSKSWKAFISSDSNFALKHLKKSSQNPHLTLFWHQQSGNYNVVSYPVYRVLKNPSINLCNSRDIQPINYHCMFVGSCNGLLCLRNYTQGGVEFSLLNPTTRKTSKKLGMMPIGNRELGYFHFTFGYNASTRAYKVVAFRANEHEGSWKSEVKVFSVGDNCWRNIQRFPVVPFNWFDNIRMYRFLTDGVHFCGLVNWLAMDMSIVSLDLSTETYQQCPLPPGFDEVPFFQPVLRVLMDCLCFSYDSKKTEFVLWKMKQYGVQESWTQLFKISYQNIQMHNIDGGLQLAFVAGFQLVCLYVNGDIVIFADKSQRLRRDSAFIYNLKDKTVERIKCRNSIMWFDIAEDYVESLVSVC